MSETVIRQAGCRTHVRSSVPSQIRVRGKGRKIVHISAGVSPIK